ncbi:MAG: AMP-binding protein, partial [Pseudomonadota bacterium]
IIILENFATVLEAVVAKTPVKHVVVASIGEMLGFPKGNIVNFVLRSVKKQVPAYTLSGHVKFNAALKQGAGMSLQKAQLTGDDVAVLQYTGGTTGPSKGATLLHRTLISALLMSEAWLKPGLERKGGIQGQTTFICALPLYHVFAFVSCSLLGIRAGGLCVLIPNPRDLDATIKEIAKYKFHIFPAVNTLFNGLAAHPEFAKLDFSQLRISNGGGMAVTQAVAERWLKITDCPICEGYGLSETSSGITCNPTNTDEFTGTVGIPMPNVEVRMIDEDGKEVPRGERGEIAIRGPQVMAGYWEKPDATEAAFTKDGFFKSGDIGTMDENGYCRVVDRIKDMIISSGFNIYPGEIEDVTGACPGVMETACVGVPDEKAGEAVVLYVIKEDQNLTEEDVRKYCAENLTGYKKPKYVEFKDEFPKTNVGKILRRELRDEALNTIGKR